MTFTQHLLSFGETELYQGRNFRLIIQISDMYVKATGELYKEKVDTHAYVALAVDHIIRYEPLPGVVLATSDLAD